MEPFPHSHDIDAWRVIRILSEFVEGFETMESLGPAVVIFGSTLSPPDNPYYIMSMQLAEKIVKKNLGIITGGGAGIMEAANKGAKLANGKSCGICIDLPLEEAPNVFIDPHYLLSFRYFFARKVMFTRYAQAFIAFPGGYGTLDELFEVLTLISTKKIQAFPVFLIGKEYWAGLIDWITHTIIQRGNLGPDALKLFTLTDDIDLVADTIDNYCTQIKNFRNY